MGGEFLSLCPKDNFVGHGRREVGKKLVKRVFFHPFDRSVWKTYNFYEKSPFCHGVDPGRHNFSPFCRGSDTYGLNGLLPMSLNNVDSAIIGQKAPQTLQYRQKYDKL